MSTITEVPQALKPKLMLWTDVNYHDMEEIEKMQSIPDLESALCRVFGVDLPEPKRGVLLELYVQTVLFCRECNFKKEQTSALLSIIKATHEANVETPLNNIEQCFKYCKELLLCHSVRLKLDLSLTYSGIPGQDEPTMENSSALDVENVMEKETEASIGEPEGATLGSQSELKGLIEREVREQMMLMSGQMDQRMKDIADQHKSAPDSPQPNQKAKKH
ncbi:cilia- and flagella-associated protein 119 isoform X2 [Pseudochaenichthys georgianus]|uniref:cilia- and flagella-associated protein 119 isoform X2 n=1 Tax=Pseudochaenichthys georgianus TaxID=52239 RepID=UPI00146D517C|nr:coiled-coil domain-containing protein 189 isoform X2 [Pseudochaenichthys georgianus]